MSKLLQNIYYDCPGCYKDSEGKKGTNPKSHVADCRIGLKEALSKIKQERDYYKDISDDLQYCPQRVEYLEKELGNLKAAVRKYGTHLMNCTHQMNWVDHNSFNSQSPKCSCGFTAVLKGT